MLDYFQLVLPVNTALVVTAAIHKFFSWIGVAFSLFPVPSQCSLRDALLGLSYEELSTHTFQELLNFSEDPDHVVNDNVFS